MSGWTDAPYVFTTLTSCPHCGTTRKPIVIRTERGGDGSRSRKQVCRVCSRRWVLVIEEPLENAARNWQFSISGEYTLNEET